MMICVLPRDTRMRGMSAGDVLGYPSPSEADLALVSLLAFWTGGDAVRIDALFRSSALMRGKWDAPRGTQTYGERARSPWCSPAPQAAEFLDPTTMRGQRT
jgi:hypothetical protein